MFHSLVERRFVSKEPIQVIQHGINNVNPEGLSQKLGVAENVHAVSAKAENVEGHDQTKLCQGRVPDHLLEGFESFLLHARFALVHVVGEEPPSVSTAEVFNRVLLDRNAGVVALAFARSAAVA